LHCLFAIFTQPTSFLLLYFLLLPTLSIYALVSWISKKKNDGDDAFPTEIQ